MDLLTLAVVLVSLSKLPPTASGNEIVLPRNVLCPPRTDRTRMLFHKETAKCYAFGTQGPCGANMILYDHPLYPNHHFGFCDCDQGFKSETPCNDYPVRRMAYIHELRQCFPIFSQGPCGERKWLNFKDADSTPQCEPNPCYSFHKQSIGKLESGQFWFFHPKRNGCFLSQTRGYCPVGRTLEVAHGRNIPICKKRSCEGKLTNFRSALTCRLGSRYSYVFRGCLVSYRYFGEVG